MYVFFLSMNARIVLISEYTYCSHKQDEELQWLIVRERQEGIVGAKMGIYNIKVKRTTNDGSLLALSVRNR